jgi:hypothetical protein
MYNDVKDSNGTDFIALLKQELTLGLQKGI